MNKNRIAICVATGVTLLYFLFDVDLVFQVGGSRTVEIPNAAVEADFERCFRERDDAMHEEAFATIDNPDVQREFISANRQRITAACREQYPLTYTEITEELPFNLIDLHPRFW